MHSIGVSNPQKDKRYLRIENLVCQSKSTTEAIVGASVEKLKERRNRYEYKLLTINIIWLPFAVNRYFIKDEHKMTLESNEGYSIIPLLAHNFRTCLVGSML